MNQQGYNPSFFTPFRVWRKVILCCMLCIISVCAMAQRKYVVSQAKLDSALKLNQSYPKNDSVKLSIMETIYRQYLGLKKKDLAEPYIDQVIKLAYEKNLRKFSAWAFYRRALGFHGRSEYLKSEENYLKAQTDFASIGNVDMVASVNLNLSDLYSGIPDYVKALEVSQKAIVIYEKMHNDEDLASCYVNISYVYQRLGNHVQAIVYLKKALKVFLLEGENSRGVAVVYEAMGVNYFEAGKAELSEMGVQPDGQQNLVSECYQKALKAAQILNDEGLIASINGHLADYYLAVNKKDDALTAYKKAVEISRNRENKYDKANSLFALGNFYSLDAKYEEAIKYLVAGLAIAKENHLLEIEEKTLLSISNIYENLKDYNRSLVYYREYVTVRDKIIDQDKKREIIKRQMQLDFGLKENDYLMKQRIDESELKRQKQQLALRQQQLILADKEKALDLLSFQKAKLALDLQHLAQENKFQKQTNEARLQAFKKDKQIVAQKQQISFDWKIKVFLIVAITLTFAFAGFIYLNQRKTNRLNQIISSQKRELEQLSRVKDRIFSVVSHDMRTPVNSLISFIQLLENGAIDQEKLKRYAASLKNSLSYTSSMMENLLNWAASQMQGFNPYLEQLNLYDLTADVLNTLKQQADDKNISLDNDLNPENNCFADSNMLSLVLRNLISNAIKFTPEGGKVNIKAQVINSKILITIADTGVGLTERQIAHFNKPGYLGAGISTPGTNKEKGTGLGLLLSRTFTGLMDGKITARLNETQGSSFIIELNT